MTLLTSHIIPLNSFLGSQLRESNDRIWRLAALHSDTAGLRDVARQGVSPLLCFYHKVWKLVIDYRVISVARPEA